MYREGCFGSAYEQKFPFKRAMAIATGYVEKQGCAC